MAFIQPLAQVQIHSYLAAGGPQLAELRQAMQTDTTLQELAQSPLMLSTMSVAYHGLSPGELTGSARTRFLNDADNCSLHMLTGCLSVKPGRPRGSYPKAGLLSQLADWKSRTASTPRGVVS